jgi:hypothetical protein
MVLHIGFFVDTTIVKDRRLYNSNRPKNSSMHRKCKHCFSSQFRSLLMFAVISCLIAVFVYELRLL